MQCWRSSVALRRDGTPSLLSSRLCCWPWPPGDNPLVCVSPRPPFIQQTAQISYFVCRRRKHRACLAFNVYVSRFGKTPGATYIYRYSSSSSSAAFLAAASAAARASSSWRLLSSSAANAANRSSSLRFASASSNRCLATRTVWLSTSVPNIPSRHGTCELACACKHRTSTATIHT